jgi:hypothetical protein
MLLRAAFALGTALLPSNSAIVFAIAATRPGAHLCARPKNRTDPVTDSDKKNIEFSVAWTKRLAAVALLLAACLSGTNSLAGESDSGTIATGIILGWEESSSRFLFDDHVGVTSEIQAGWSISTLNPPPRGFFIGYGEETEVAHAPDVEKISSSLGSDKRNTLRSFVLFFSACDFQPLESHFIHEFGVYTISPRRKRRRHLVPAGRRYGRFQRLHRST